MVRADQKPGRRRAEPEPGNGAGARTRWARSPRAWGALWLLVAGIAALGLATGWTVWDEPRWLSTAGAVTVLTLYAWGLAFRAGGRPVLTGALALSLSLAAVLSERPVLVAGAAVGTAVVAAVLGVLSTTPSASFAGVVRECVMATAIAALGAFAVEAYQAQVSLERVKYLVLGLSLLGALSLAYRLGGGLHGLGRRGATALVSGLGLLLVTLAYTEALSRWGSPGMIAGVDDTIRGIRSSIGAVPRPVAVLLGFPALAWGVSARARRRQGWWGCAFGAAGLAVVTVSLLNPTVSLLETGLMVLYSAILGLLLGYLVIRADQYLTGTRGRRARQIEEASAHRPEPGRLQPLL